MLLVDASGVTDNRVVRWEVTASLDGLLNRVDIVTGQPWFTNHNGCRPRFGPDGFLYVGTGDAAVGTNPQSGTSLGGKVLRVDRNGAAAPGNSPPAGGDARIFNYGHRNVQGIAFRASDSFGVSVEHGPDKDDEVNRIVPGNFGWDPVPGYNQTVPMTDSTKFPNAVKAIWWSGTPTNAPSGATFLSGPQWKSWNGAARGRGAQGPAAAPDDHRCDRQGHEAVARGPRPEHAAAAQRRAGPRRQPVPRHRRRRTERRDLEGDARLSRRPAWSHPAPYPW